MKRIAACWLLLSLSTLVSAQKGKPLYKAEIGLQTYTFRNSFPKNILATLDTIKAMGIKELEAGPPKGMTAQEFRKACDERGLKIPSTGGGYDQLVKNPQATIEQAKILGARYVMCAWIPHERGNFNLENAKKAVADFNAIGKAMKENGLTFCYHNHGYEFKKYGDGASTPGTLMDYIIQNTNPEYVSFEMDILWTIHGGGDPVALLKKYGSRWKLMHLKDLKKGVVGDGSGGTPPENDVVLGEGQADFVGILKEANRIGIRHFFIEDESNDEYVQVPKSIAYLKSLRE